MKYVLLQVLLTWHLLRSLACAAQCFSAAHISALSLFAYAALVAYRLGGFHPFF